PQYVIRFQPVEHSLSPLYQLSIKEGRQVQGASAHPFFRGLQICWNIPHSASGCQGFLSVFPSFPRFLENVAIAGHSAGAAVQAAALRITVVIQNCPDYITFTKDCHFRNSLCILFLARIHSAFLLSMIVCCAKNFYTRNKCCHAIDSL